MADEEPLDFLGLVIVVLTPLLFLPDERGVVDSSASTRRGTGESEASLPLALLVPMSSFRPLDACSIGGRDPEQK